MSKDALGQAQAARDEAADLLTKGRDKVSHIAQELADREARIDAAKRAGDLSAPLTEWRAEVRELKVQWEDACDDCEMFEGIVAEREKAVSAAIRDQVEDEGPGVAAGYAAVGAGWIEAIDQIRAGFVSFDGLRRTHMKLTNRGRKHAELAGLTPPRVPGIVQSVGINEKTIEMLRELVRHFDQHGHTWRV